MFGLNITKLNPAVNSNYVNYASLQPNNNFVKNTFNFTANLEHPRTKSDFTREELCGAHICAENLDLLA